MIKINHSVKNIHSCYNIIRSFQQSCTHRTKWDLISAVCVERKPVITPSLSSVEEAFQTLIQIVDLGVTSLVREPKKRLKFNLVVDKTLNGVILKSQLEFQF